MILSFDSSSVTASAALMDGDTEIRSEFQNSGLTHSETLLPLIKRVMGDTPYSKLDAVAITTGPGSFTGVRIGVATAKGLSFNDGIPCIPVSSLEAVAFNFDDMECVVCVVMDARRMQVYNAIFEIKNGVVTRLTKDRAISIDDLEQDLLQYESIVIAGDGAKLFCDNAKRGNAYKKASDDKIYVNGIGVAKAARGEKSIAPESLMPIYLRPSQAERELKLKREKDV